MLIKGSLRKVVAMEIGHVFSSSATHTAVLNSVYEHAIYEILHGEHWLFLSHFRDPTAWGGGGTECLILSRLTLSTNEVRIYACAKPTDSIQQYFCAYLR